MFADNDYYGHAGILRRYCGVEGSPPMPGRLQHGWTVEHGLPVHAFAEPWPRYVWGDRNLRCIRRDDLALAEAIGAPFLYLPQAPSPSPSRGPRSVLALPFHGWEKAKVSADFHALAGSLQALTREGLGPVTVCLYWMEYEDTALRKIFENQGFAVVTNGRRDGNPGFLERQRALLWEHALVTSNRVSTATFYALAAERPFFLWGPPAGLSGSDDPDGARFDAWQRAEFPALTWARFDGGVQRDLGLQELGANHQRGPAALRELLAWTPTGASVRLWRRAQRQLWRLRRAVKGPGA
jgi:hypothetical protein